MINAQHHPRLRDKVIVVTGAGSGIGRRAVDVLVGHGARVAAIDLPSRAGASDPLQEYADLSTDTVSIHHADITDARALEGAAAEIVGLHGRIDGVLACAAVLRGGSVLTTTDDDHLTTMRVNIDGTLNTIRATIPGLRAAGGGSIVLMSSLAGTRGNPEYSSYVASKHAVIGIMRTAAKEFGADFIRVNTVNPTIVNTPMTNGDRDGRDELPFADRTDSLRHRHALPIPFIEPADVVNAAVFLLSDESRYVTGSMLLVDAGASA